MALKSKTRSIVEGFIREGAFKWAMSRRSTFDEEFEEMGRSPSGQRKWISELSPIANVVVGRCSRILEISMDDLQQNFDSEASDLIKSSNYARNFLEYCCFRVLALSTQVNGYLADRNFKRLTFDMMLAWEAPAVSSQPASKVDLESNVSLESFSRIASSIPSIADVITSANLFELLVSSSGGRLTFPVYEKYLNGLDRAVKKMKSQSESSVISGLRTKRGERILEVDGTLTTQPVLEHIGISTWPGRLTLTDHALYFEPLKVVTFDKAKVYDLADDLKQVVRPELTGPWGTRLFDKAVMYKSLSQSEPVIMEFPELTGHSRRDYWLAATREILHAHSFIRKFQIKGIEKEEILSKAVLGILRLQALQEMFNLMPLRCEVLLMFNLCDQLPGGDLILETLARMTLSRGLDRAGHSPTGSRTNALSASAILSSMGLVSEDSDARLLVGEVVVGQLTPLEKAVAESRDNYRKVEHVQATIDGVKVDGIDTNLAVMKELLQPITQLGHSLVFLSSWDEPWKSLVFCSCGIYIILRGWLVYSFVIALLFLATFMLLNRFCSQGSSIVEIKVAAPPPMNTMEQLLAVQNAISQVEGLVQDGNIALLKLRALILAVPSQAADRAVMVLVFAALAVAFLPAKLLFLLFFLEMSTRYSPPRRPATERLTRRLREWWFSIPAAPVVLDKDDDKKKK